MRQIETIILIGLGAFVGANLRYWISGVAAVRLGQSFPWGTLIVNVTGSFLLAVFLSWAANQMSADPRLRLLAVIGLFGGFTTFSTFANESMALVQSGNWLGAVWNVLGMNALCLLGVVLGVFVGNRL